MAKASLLVSVWMLLECVQSMSTTLAFSPQMFVLTAPTKISYTCVLDPVVHQLHLLIDLPVITPSCPAVHNNPPLFNSM